MISLGRFPQWQRPPPLFSGTQCRADVYLVTPDSKMRTSYPRYRCIARLEPNAKQALIVLLIIFSPVASFGDQITSGTIIVIAQTKRSVIIAGDSRAGETNDGITITSTNDCECKLAALGGNTAFAAAGVIGNREKHWKAASEAANARAATIRGDAPIGSSDGDLILKRWAESMMNKLSDFSTQSLIAVANANKGRITTGVLAGVEADGSVWIHDVAISFSSVVGLSYQGHTLTSNDPPTAYYFLGKSEIGMEFEEFKTSERSIRERARWSRLKLKGRAFDRFKTRRLVELTIEFHPDKSEVGGKVDEIELDSKGVRWTSLKKNCQQGDAIAPPTKARAECRP